MRKTFCLAAGLAVAFSASIASAQMTASFFLDARDNFGDIDSPTLASGYANDVGGGGRGGAQTIYIAPKIGASGLEMQTTDTSTAHMTLYVDVDSADTMEVLAAVGLDLSIAAPAANERQLLNTSVTIHNSAPEVGGGLMNAPWNDTAESTAFTTAGGGMKMVRVPVDNSGMGGAPAFNASLGITNNDTDAYRLATIDLEADNCNVTGRGCEPSLDVYLSVNNLLVTAVSNPGPSAAVTLQLGYDAGAPEGATANGSTEGATSSAADAMIVIRTKGDFNGDQVTDGGDLGLVLPTFSQAVSQSANSYQVWAGDYNGDGVFDGGDLGFVLSYFSAVVAECQTCN